MSQTNNRSAFHPFRLLTALLCLPMLAASLSAENVPVKANPGKIGWFEPVIQQIEGWTVSVDPQLLSGPFKDEGDRALKMLANHLQRIAIIMPEKQLASLRKVGIWIEHSHPELHTLQYHPEVEWLTEHGYDPQLAKKVHIPRAAEMFSRKLLLAQPAVILHELAHAYHDQVLSFDDPGILHAYKNAMDKGLYEKSLLYTGKIIKHYATTDHKEYFAESTEAYFSQNDFYPFVNAELRIHDPVCYAELERIWGKVD